MAWVFEYYCVFVHPAYGYVICTKNINKKTETIRLHRLVMKLIENQRHIKVDHINGNRLDNRKENLRICTPQQNSFHKTRTPNGKYRNTYFCRGWWLVSVQASGKKFTPGKCFKNRDEAAKIADEIRKKVYGESAFQTAEKYDLPLQPIFRGE